MIRSMRHNLVLTLYATIGLAGLAAAALGLIAAGSVLLFTIVAAANLQGTGFRFDFAAVLCGGWLLLGTAGGLVAWFGLRTWYRRKLAGPAPDEDSVAKTPLGRALAVIVFAGFAIYAAVTLVFMLGAYGRDAMLAVSGVTTTARIVDYTPLTEVHTDAVRVRYVFTTLDGQTIEGGGNQWSWQVDQLKKTGTTPVTYLPDDPAFQKMDFSFDLQDTLGLFGQYFALLAVGIWGAGKNAGLWSRGESSRPDVPHRRGAEAKVELAVRTVPRATFGRR